VDRSTLLHYVNVTDDESRLYGVALKQAGSEGAGPIHWASCLYDSSQRLYFNNIIITCFYR